MEKWARSNCCVCWEEIVCFAADGAFRSGVNLYLCVCSECCGSAMALARNSHGIVFLYVGVSSCCLHSPPSMEWGYYRQGGSRLRWVFEINYFSSVQLTPWITLGLKILYPVVILSCKTVLIHQKKALGCSTEEMLNEFNIWRWVFFAWYFCLVGTGQSKIYSWHDRRLGCVSSCMYWVGLLSNFKAGHGF